MANIDLKLSLDDNDIYDINIDDNGDIENINSFDTAILMSLITDKRADESEVKQPQNRRGWWGNSLNDDIDYEIGSKLWLLEQERATQDILNNSIDYTSECLSWMIEDNLVDDIIIDAELNDNEIILEIKFIRKNNESIIFYNLWENTVTWQ